MNRHTGRSITTLEHIAQSIGDILTTRIGSRVMRRQYGSQLVDLIDQPGNPATRLLCYAAIAMAVMRWEPRVRISRVQLSDASMAGQFELTLDVTVIDSNEQQSISIPLSLGAIG
ncbi:GPW/gp25 family protein [Pseudomonas sp. SA3-5]|uniref:GPW/gp25 family protein n=1 Tax=Pseudomonas aestuarii TaxID=3018340 RepID=A0ABT4XE89_9PSED|nr:GPW/gp25 family protein [Pseudomonas aestuarii]MDA7086506.1 GPW/gp25 family protein [Pseudomonas aestuarii]